MALRHAVNPDESCSVAVLEILEDHPKAIIFYSYNYTLDILKSFGYFRWYGDCRMERP